MKGRYLASTRLTLPPQRSTNMADIVAWGARGGVISGFERQAGSFEANNGEWSAEPAVRPQTARTQFSHAHTLAHALPNREAGEAGNDNRPSHGGDPFSDPHARHEGQGGRSPPARVSFFISSNDASDAALANSWWSLRGIRSRAAGAAASSSSPEWSENILFRVFLASFLLIVVLGVAAWCWLRRRAAAQSRLRQQRAHQIWDEAGGPRRMDSAGSSDAELMRMHRSGSI